MEPESVMSDKMQEEFEKWASGKGLILRKATSGKQFYYLFEDTDYAWEAWQAARTVPEWISVTDRLPEQDVSFLAVTDCGGDIYISTMRLPVLISKNSKPDGDFIRERVTHWMPLPAAPEVKK